MLISTLVLITLALCMSLGCTCGVGGLAADLPIKFNTLEAMQISPGSNRLACGQYGAHS